jgi:general secretion pathway protein L
MITARVEWQASASQWFISPWQPERGFLPAQPLTDWASEQPDLSSVQLLLSAHNYSAHWVTMPGVSKRHLARALPFALEEQLIEDPEHYLIVPGSAYNKRQSAYALNRQHIDDLIEACQLHHVRITGLIPETELFADQHRLVRWQQGWLWLWPGQFEGWLSDGALNLVLEDQLDGHSEQSLTIVADTMDQAQLLKTTLESGYGDALSSVEIQVAATEALLQKGLNGRHTNLLNGLLASANHTEQRPPAWWRPLAGLAAAITVVSVITLLVDNHQIQQREQLVRKEANELYRSLFPGERIRSLERQFREKLRTGGEGGGNEGFVPLVNQLAKVYASGDHNSKLELQSMRFSDRDQQLTVEVSAAELSQLQSFRQALEQAGLQAEVANASNDAKGVKGRLKVGAQA